MKRYAEYKDSGIEWIGEIPKEWSVVPIKRILSAIQDGTHATFTRVANGSPLLSAKNVSDNGVEISDNESLISEEDFNAIVSNGFPMTGDVLLCCVGTIGRCCIYSFDKQMAFQRSVSFLRVNSKMSNRFLLYSLKSVALVRQMIAFANSSAQSGIYIGIVKSLMLTLPPVAIQQSIVTYLDHKTAAIDELIADKQKLVTLLQEKRTAVISEAVTKGLDKTAKMKGSGVEWIGEIPQSWDIKLVSRMATIIRGASPRPAGDERYFNGSDVHWITVAEVTNGDEKYITDTESYLTNEGKSKSRFVESGTLLLSNSGATLGVPKITLIDGCINDGSVAFLDLDVTQMYLFYAFKCRTSELRKQMQGYGQPNLNTTIIKNIAFPYPDKVEQQQIVAYLDQKTAQIDALISDINEQIEKFKEYRQAVISEAVTGKVAV